MVIAIHTLTNDVFFTLFLWLICEGSHHSKRTKKDPSFSFAESKVFEGKDRSAIV